MKRIISLMVARLKADLKMKKKDKKLLLMINIPSSELYYRTSISSIVWTPASLIWPSEAWPRSSNRTKASAWSWWTGSISLKISNIFINRKKKRWAIPWKKNSPGRPSSIWRRKWATTCHQWMTFSEMARINKRSRIWLPFKIKISGKVLSYRPELKGERLWIRRRLIRNWWIEPFLYCWIIRIFINFPSLNAKHVLLWSGPLIYRKRLWPKVSTQMPSHNQQDMTHSTTIPTSSNLAYKAMAKSS